MVVVESAFGGDGIGAVLDDGAGSHPKRQSGGEQACRRADDRRSSATPTGVVSAAVTYFF
ncbi:hypothetical protein [Mycobacterium sp. URHB0021]